MKDPSDVSTDICVLDVISAGPADNEHSILRTFDKYQCVLTLQGER